MQEDFLVLQGECILVVEGQERRLRPWDYVHCPPGVAHAFVCTGEGPCVIVGAGNRREDLERDYLEEDVAARHGATAASNPRAAGSSWRVERPASWDDLPWSDAAGAGG